MALMRCFTSIRVRPKQKPESTIALLVHGDDRDDDDEDYPGKISTRRLSWDDERAERAGVVDVEYCDTVKLGGIRRLTWDEIGRLKTFSSLAQNFGYGEFTKKFYNGRGGLRIFEHELQILLLLQHDNIVKLAGYGHYQGGGAVILQNIGNETLRDKLRFIGGTSRRGMKSGVFSWKNRMKIARQLIQAIEYLHEKCPIQIIHMDIKPSNVLIDEQLNSKLWNFESAKMGTEDKSSASNGRIKLFYPGYTDFHYLSTGVALKQHDIYSFGIIVLELITGTEAPVLHSRGSVVSLANSMVRDQDLLVKMVDPRLEGDFDMKEAMNMADISAMCLLSSPSLRPSASDVVLMMSSKSITSTIIDKKSEK